jgi:hypothetical protein
MTSRAKLRLVQPPAPEAALAYVVISQAARLRMESAAAKVNAAQRAFLGSFTTSTVMERVKRDLVLANAEIALVRLELEVER